MPNARRMKQAFGLIGTYALIEDTIGTEIGLWETIR
jgi:hypothetical protein